MNRHPELDRIETAAAFAFAPYAVPPPSRKEFSGRALALLIFLGGLGALIAAFIMTRPYQLEAKIAKEKAAAAQQEAATAKEELSRIHRCVVGGGP